MELGQYLCEVRSKQYWGQEKLTLFDEFLEKRFADSRQQAHYLMAIHENLPRIPKHELQQLGWSKVTELVKSGDKGRGKIRSCNLFAHAKHCQRKDIKGGVEDSRAKKPKP